jgi:hypothetical protein
VCPACPWDEVIDNPLLDKLLRSLSLQDAGAPVGRHELSDDEWLLLGRLKAERMELMKNENKNEGDG